VKGGKGPGKGKGKGKGQGKGKETKSGTLEPRFNLIKSKGKAQVKFLSLIFLGFSWIYIYVCVLVR